VAQKLIVQMFMFVVVAKFLLVAAELDVAEAIATKQANRFVVLAEFCQGAVVRHVVVPTIINLPVTFAVVETYCQNQREQLVAGP
jgi:hypothetical protein